MEPTLASFFNGLNLMYYEHRNFRLSARRRIDINWTEPVFRPHRFLHAHESVDYLKA